MAAKEKIKTKDEEAKKIRQEIKMTADERQTKAKNMKQEYYGKKLPDIRDY